MDLAPCIRRKIDSRILQNKTSFWKHNSSNHQNRNTIKEQYTSVVLEGFEVSKHAGDPPELENVRLKNARVHEAINAHQADFEGTKTPSEN